MRKKCMYAVFLLSLLVSCTPQDTQVIQNNQSGDVAQLAEMNQIIGWKIFRQAQLDKPRENVVVSPYSLQTALQMALNGANGITRKNMLDFLEWQADDVDDLNLLNQDLTQILTKSGNLRCANAYFYDPSRISVKPTFTETLSAAYKAETTSLSFNDSQQALNAINSWVNNSTEGKINQILNKITDQDVAFLINALYFKSDWATGFDPNASFTQSFTRADGSTKQVKYFQADRLFNFSQTENFNLVDIPFKDSIFSLNLIQSNSSNQDPNWHLNITPSTWSNMFNKMVYSRAQVLIPRMDLTYDNDMVEIFKNLGMDVPFSDINADFSKMGTAANPIFIRQFKHKLILKVDEKGAEGAAVSSIGFGINSAPPTFFFNAPFVLALRHIPTNTLLFLGYISDPKP